MLVILLLQLIYSFQSSSGAERETLCTSDACFTLHHEELSFEEAQKDCEGNGGNLMTLRDKNEESELLELIRAHHSKRFSIWIGLKRNKKDCMLADKTLKGFKWISGEEDSQYSNWEKEPVATCLERCVKVEYTALEPDQLKWNETSCKTLALYACKFSFKGMCSPLSLLGPETVAYTPPFSREPLKSEINLLPIGTFALIYCDNKESSYSLCKSINDIYKWSEPGPFCQLKTQNCAINNGGCEHLCLQAADAVRCDCKGGFELRKDGLSCRPTDLCGPDSCEHQCVTGELGVICSCPNGFQLSENQRNCSDIDECQSEVCRGGVCVNAAGSYKCVCRDGYGAISGDCGHAEDCSRLGCEHGCLNNNGSFSCSCSEGFILSQDGHSCVDGDGCASSPCLSDFTCVNTEGSFICVRRPKDDELTETPAHVSVLPAGPPGEEPQEDFTESLTGTTVELQHQSPHTDAPQPDLVNVTDRRSQAANQTKSSNTKLLVCVLGSAIPLLLVVTLTLFIIIFRCSQTKKEVEKKTTADGYCWVSPDLDPRLEKLYESISTDDL